MEKDLVAPSARHVLIVDDDQMVLKLMGRVVTMQGLRCTTALSGEEAVEYLAKEPFDVVVVDKNLPGINGLEVVRQARNLQPGVPVLLLTGYSSEESALEAAALGVVEYMLKPIDINEFGLKLRLLVRESIPPLPYRAARASKRALTGTSSPLSAPAKPTAPGPEPASDPGLSVKVLLVEPDRETCQKIARILREMDCDVVAFHSVGEGVSHAERHVFDVLVASPSILTARDDWFAERGWGEPLGAVALMSRGGVDKVIEAIQLGARGVLTPPFDESKVRFEFRRVILRLVEERVEGRGTTDWS